MRPGGSASSILARAVCRAASGAGKPDAGQSHGNLGAGGESLDSILAQQRAGRDEPIVTVLHLACPRVEYLDRGKSSIVVPGSRAR